jgi:transposase InsO family protein/transposase-like protein
MSRGKRNPKLKRYESEFKLRVIKTAEEKNLSNDEVKEVFGVSMATFIRWKQLYRDGGEEAIRADSKTADARKSTLPEPVRAKYREHVLETKQKYPFFGIGRIWHWIRRTLFLPVSYRFVKRTLKEEGLVQPVVSRKRAPPQPKRFERARPNQMWQSDITAFTITKGLRVYLIGFMDDYSRYLVGWGLYAGQSGGLVLEVLRNAIATYGRPEELLTDNGRQYKSWQGETDFQRELKREGIKHITSRPHHPQTLGKIEAFWGHMKREFLAHVVMGGLEDMRERMDHWVKYYNFQRPHEGIDNQTPAERYFRFSRIARLEIERRIKRNEKDLALLDKPRETPPIGQLALGEKILEVKKEGDGFVVILDGQEMNSSELDKEKTDVSKEEPGREDPDPGSGSESQGVTRDPSSIGRENDQPSMPGLGPKDDAVLQARRTDDLGDAPGSQIPAEEGPGDQSPGTSRKPGGKDPDSKAGISKSAELGADLKEALQDPGAKNEEIRPSNSENRDAAGAGAASAGSAAAPGTSAEESAGDQRSGG